MPTRVELALLPPSCLHCSMLLRNMGLPFLETKTFCSSWYFLWDMRPWQLAWPGLVWDPGEHG